MLLLKFVIVIFNQFFSAIMVREGIYVEPMSALSNADIISGIT